MTEPKIGPLRNGGLQIYEQTTERANGEICQVPEALLERNGNNKANI